MDREQLSRVMTLTHISDEKERKENLSYCHVCLTKTKLTKEHIPPESAFNEDNKLWDRLVFDPPITSRKVPIRGGFWVKTLCEGCNMKKGSIYAKQYVKLVKDFVTSPKLFAPSGNARLFTIRADTLYIAKEIAIMILAIEPLSFARQNKELREFVLNRDKTFTPNFRVLSFLVPEVKEAGTINRYHARVDTFARGFKFFGGEISWFPFGFIYAYQIGDKYEIDKMTDITHWFTQSNKSERYNRMEQFYVRITGVDSLQCVYGNRRTRPQIDFL